MKNNLLFLIGSALIAAGNVLAEAEAASDGSPESVAAPTGAEEPKRRGRPPGSTNAPKEPATAPAGATSPVQQPAAGNADAARFQKNRSLIEPIVKGDIENGIAPQGEEVKKIIKKYSESGLLKDLPAACQSQFEGDIAALSY